MNIKKAAAGVLAVMLAATALPVTASATGLFGNQVDQVKKAKEESAYPSYATYALVPADTVTETEESVTYEYDRVELQDFEGFGVYLEEAGFSVTDSYTEGTTYVYNLSDAADGEVVDMEDVFAVDEEGKVFVLSYDSEAEELLCIYSPGVNVQYPAFINELPYTAQTSSMDKVKADEYKSDRYGHTYAHSLALRFSDHGNISLLPNKQYGFFSGILAAPAEEDVSGDRLGYINIYLDGELAYESEGISTSTPPVKFVLDISKAREVKIEWFGSYYDDNSHYATIFNGVFY